MPNRTWEQWLSDEASIARNGAASAARGVGRGLSAAYHAPSNLQHLLEKGESYIPHIPVPQPAGALSSFEHTVGGLADQVIHPLTSAGQMGRSIVDIPTGLLHQGLSAVAPKLAQADRSLAPGMIDRSVQAASGFENVGKGLVSGEQWGNDPFGNALTLGTLLEGGEGALLRAGVKGAAKTTANLMGRTGRALQLPATMPFRVGAKIVGAALPGKYGPAPAVQDGKLTEAGNKAVADAGIRPDVAAHPKFIEAFDRISQDKGAHAASAKQAALEAAGVNPADIKTSMVDGTAPQDSAKDDYKASLGNARSTVKTNLGQDFGQEYAGQVRDRAALYDTAHSHPGVISPEAVENLPGYISDELSAGNHASITKMTSLPKSYPNARSALLGDAADGEGPGLLRNAANFAREGDGLTLADAQLLRTELRQHNVAAATPDPFGNVNGTDMNATSAVTRGYDKWFEDVTKNPDYFNSPNADQVAQDFQNARQSHAKIRDTYFSDQNGSGNAHPNVVSARKAVDRSGYGKFDEDFTPTPDQSRRMGDALTSGAGSDSENLSEALGSSFGDTLHPDRAADFGLHHQALSILDDADAAMGSAKPTRFGGLTKHLGPKSIGAGIGAFAGTETANLVAPLLPMGGGAHYVLPELGAYLGAKAGDTLASARDTNATKAQATGAPVVKNPPNPQNAINALALNQAEENGKNPPPAPPKTDDGNIKMGNPVAADDFNSLPAEQAPDAPSGAPTEAGHEFPEPQGMKFDKPVKAEEFASGGRAAFASGGRAHVNPHTVDRLVNKLMKRLNGAKKEASKMTEPLLNQDDSTIAHALHLAQKGI